VVNDQVTFELLYQNTDLVIIDKPAGYHVHPPEIRPEKVPRHRIILHQLRDQIGQRVHPLHRLDAGTSGVLAFALNPEAASYYGQIFQTQEVGKKYWTLVRGFLPMEGEISMPLELDSTGTLVEAITLYKTISQIELPGQVGSRHSTVRYSWLEVFPKTGKFHQIRRHMNRISHPVIGDSTHGDSRHNQFFREQLKIPGLCLRAIEISLPRRGESDRLIVSSGEDSKWKKIKALFGQGL
jgi:tRNA pseudouridine65 synthase